LGTPARALTHLRTNILTAPVGGRGGGGCYTCRYRRAGGQAGGRTDARSKGEDVVSGFGDSGGILRVTGLEESMARLDHLRT